MRASLLALLMLLMAGCERKTETYSTEKAPDYLPLQAGKYRTYRLDSLVTVNFGSSMELHSYQEKHVVDAAFEENNQTTYRIYRYLRNAAGTEPWKAAGSYMISIGKNVEVVENNLRFIKLATPVKTDSSWKGNSFLPPKPYAGLFQFNNDNEIQSWDYRYTATGETVLLNNKTFNDVVTVLAVDESLNVPVTNPQNYAFKNFQLEKYAKAVGLIYQELTMFEYQPQSANRPGYTGFGVKRSLIDFN